MEGVERLFTVVVATQGPASDGRVYSFDDSVYAETPEEAAAEVSRRLHISIVDVFAGMSGETTTGHFEPVAVYEGRPVLTLNAQHFQTYRKQ